MGIGNYRADVQRDAHLDAGCRSRGLVMLAQEANQVAEEVVDDCAGWHAWRYHEENPVSAVFLMVVMLPEVGVFE
jgi:hypothetical protein